MSQTLEWDNTKNKIYKIACLRCDSFTNHKVLTSVKCNWSEDEIGIGGIDTFETVECLGCDVISFRLLSSNSENAALDDNGDVIYPDEETLYPNRIAGRKQIEDLYFFPQDILKVYKETHGALCSRFKILAGVGIRVLVESVCKNKNALGDNLEKKIDDLVGRGILSKDGADILHKTRLLGNRAAHEIVEPKEEELDVAMDIIENLLKNVYIIPEKAQKLKIGVPPEKII